MILVIILIGFPLFIMFMECWLYLFSGHREVHIVLIRIAEIEALIILPLMYAHFGALNDCCGDSAVFSKDHLPIILSLYVLCLIAYFYSSYRTEIATPIIEVVVNCLLLLGIVLNIFISIHTNEWILAIAGNMPIIILAIFALIKNQGLFIEYTTDWDLSANNNFENIAWKVLHFKPIFKIPILLVLCLPILVFISAFLLLFGQKPDSIILAFTETYKHGLSQWDFKCDNVVCGGHYLCSVAANGHPSIVHPQRFGKRNGNNIICNRQLLISNAFEELIQEKLPYFHRIIRSQYNKVGHFVHQYYGVFSNKYFSDAIYFLMKPLEWMFLLTLYALDKKPENRISKQYVGNNERVGIELNLKTKKSKLIV